MITKTQAAAGGSLGVIGAGGATVGTKLSSKNYDSSIVNVLNYDFTVLAWEDDYSTFYSTSTGDGQTIGNKYAWYLTGTYGIEYKDEKHSLDLQNNENWWKWAFNRWKADTYGEGKNLEGVFSRDNVEFAYSPKGSEKENANKALNRVCESIYKKKVNEWTDEENLLRYCSPIGGKPIVIRDSKLHKPETGNSSVETYVKGKEGVLVSVYSIDKNINDMFFYLKGNEFFGKVNENGIGKDLSDSNNYFYKIYQKKSDANRKISIYDECEDVYSFSKISSDLKEENLNNYCSWSFNK